MRTVMVTGSSQGVGFGIARVFLKHGWRVFGIDMKPPHEGMASQADYVHTIADLREAADCEKVMSDCLERFGQLDALVNNAGLGNARGFLETTDEDYERYYSINVRSVLRLCRLAIPALKQSHGSIVNLASVFGFVGAAGSAAYVPTKFAIVGITKMLATEFGKDGIRVNAVAPGLIWSPGTDDRIKNSKWWKGIFIDGCPMGRIGQPEEIGEAIAFLASDAASFINGVILPVDGGWSTAKFLPEPMDGSNA